MLVVVISLLMFQLHSFQRTLLVLLTAPLGMIGVTLTLILFAAPFGFVAMLGVIALAGMIMQLGDSGGPDRARHPRRHRPLGGGGRLHRAPPFRPIMLTAAAAILAMIPLTRSTFWGRWRWPSWGLLVATVLTLLFLPALYAAWFKVKRPA